MKVTPFKINVPDSVLNDLQERLHTTRLADAPKDAGWSYGTDGTYLKELLDYWQHKYDWRKHEAELNKFPQFKAEIDGIEIHFIHATNNNDRNSMPIILTHGWPDSFYRFHKVIPRLVEQGFNVVVPSMPGFGFSGHTAMAESRVADLWAKLMIEALGYEKFMAAGGDLGAPVTKQLALKYPQNVAAIHLTDVGYPTGSEDFTTLSAAEQKFAGACQQWWYMEGAYNMLHSTKPQTLAYALNDSPVGLASWMVEKFHAWADNHGDIEKRFSKDELLTNIMIYWATQTIATSLRMYAENTRAFYTQPGGPKPLPRIEVPTAVAIFPGEMVELPREWADRAANVVRFTKMKSGGHFAALEEPELFAQDIHDFAEELRKKMN